MNDEERRKILVLIHQVSLREFQREFKFGIWDVRQKAVVEIQKSLCGGRKTENLIESTCFDLKISRVHVLCSNFSRKLGQNCVAYRFLAGTIVYANRGFSELNDCR